MNLATLLSILGLIIIVPCCAYLWLLALASIRTHFPSGDNAILHRFAIAIPAHNEEAVIGHTVATLRRMDYPPDLYDIYVAADFCTDQTASLARAEGAVCFERNQGERNGKGGALVFLFENIFRSHQPYDAFVVFDADTRVNAQFLRVMNQRLNQGAQVIQGRHVISNPDASIFSCLTWAMMTIETRFSNQGRRNLHISAKLQGDSTCFRSDLIKKYGWGIGLTEDQDFRIKLIMENIFIDYERFAIGYGQAAISWKAAESQRLRWAKGMSEVNNRYRWSLLSSGFWRMDWNRIDAVILSIAPSYSTMSLLSMIILALHLIFLQFVSPLLIWLWLAVTILLFIYPLFGLFLEGAPLKAYLILLSGPVFIFWRTWLRLKLRFSKKPVTWLRTDHNAKNFG